MTYINEGCTLNQIVMFCERHKITYYALDCRFQTISTNKDNGYQQRNKLPVLYFMVACNHLYPIYDKHMQLSISNINKQIGGCRAHKTIHDTRPSNTANIQIIHNIEEYLYNMENNTYNYIVVVERGVVDSIFKYHVRNGDLYNNNFKVVNNKIVRFKVNDTTIEENVDYEAVVTTIERLNNERSNNKYIYSIHNVYII